MLKRLATIEDPGDDSGSYSQIGVDLYCDKWVHLTIFDGAECVSASLTPASAARLADALSEAVRMTGVSVRG